MSRGKHRGSSGKPTNRFQIRVFPEGKVTEDIYLTRWHRIYRTQIDLSIAPHIHTTPLELVERAIRERAYDLREERRKRGKAFDEYWCVIDVDEHPKLPQAIALAEGNSINLVISNPCLELWFLLHFNHRTAYLDRHTAQREAEAHLSCGKKLTPEALDLLIENYEVAQDRAIKLDAKHAKDGSPPRHNPSSNIWKLIERFRTGKAL